MANSSVSRSAVGTTSDDDNVAKSSMVKSLIDSNRQLENEVEYLRNQLGALETQQQQTSPGGLFKWFWCCKQVKDREGEWMEPIPRPRPAAESNNTSTQQGEQNIADGDHSGDKERAKQLWTQAVNQVVDLDLKELDNSENDRELMRGLPTHLQSFRRGSLGDVEVEMDSDDDSVLQEAAERARSQLKEKRYQPIKQEKQASALIKDKGQIKKDKRVSFFQDINAQII